MQITTKQLILLSLGTQISETVNNRVVNAIKNDEIGLKRIHFELSHLIMVSKPCTATTYIDRLFKFMIESISSD